MLMRMTLKVTARQIDDFRSFALKQMGYGGCESTIDELYDRWRLECPNDDELREDVSALKASLRDMEAGETGRPIEEFSRDFKARHDITGSR